jgi:hypothetical protein
VSDDRQRPDYGEYATPEEQRAMQMPLDPRAANDPNAPLAQLASMESVILPPPAVAPDRRLRVDRVITAILLGYGLISVLSTIPRYLDFTALANEAFRISGIPGEFSNFAQGASMGNAAAFILAVGFGVTVWLTIRRWRRGQRAWWVPVVGALVTNIPVMICLMVALMNDPAMLDYATLVGS